MSVSLAFTPSDGNYRFNQTLTASNGVVGNYTFDVRWNTRASAWYFDMYDTNGTIIVAGVKVVINVPLGRRSAHPFFVRDSIIALDSSLDNLDPGFDDIGTRVQVWHYNEKDLAALLLG